MERTWFKVSTILVISSVIVLSIVVESPAKVSETASSYSATNTSKVSK